MSQHIISYNTLYIILYTILSLYSVCIYGSISLTHLRSDIHSTILPTNALVYWRGDNQTIATLDMDIYNYMNISNPTITVCPLGEVGRNVRQLQGIYNIYVKPYGEVS